MDDVVLVTAESVRYDFVDAMPFVAESSPVRGIVGGHYTRPSLASLLSSQYEAALQARAIPPTLPEVLSTAGYTCIGLAPSAQTDGHFGFDRGFDYYENFKDPGNRGSRRREILGQIGLFRKLYHRLVPPHAKQDDLPDDDAVVDEAIEQFADADPPRFLWVHLMESHRPYGAGEQAVPKSIDRKALFSPGSLTEDERTLIRDRYRDALGRVDARVRRLYDEVDGEPRFLFTSDHGDEFGEEGPYFHQPQRRRVADALITVPVATRNLELSRSPLSLLDVAPTLADAVGADVPGDWDGVRLAEKAADYTLTIAPWGTQASLACRTPTCKVVGTDAAVAIVTDDDRHTIADEDVPEELQRQLRDLGYVG